MAGVLHVAKATQKTLSEPNSSDGLKKIFNNESMNFSQNWVYLFQPYVMLMKITTLFFVEKNCRFLATKMVILSDEFVINLLSQRK